MRDEQIVELGLQLAVDSESVAGDERERTQNGCNEREETGNEFGLQLAALDEWCELVKEKRVTYLYDI